MLGESHFNNSLDLSISSRSNPLTTGIPDGGTLELNDRPLEIGSEEEIPIEEIPIVDETNILLDDLPPTSDEAAATGSTDPLIGESAQDDDTALEEPTEPDLLTNPSDGEEAIESADTSEETETTSAIEVDEIDDETDNAETPPDDIEPDDVEPSEVAEVEENLEDGEAIETEEGDSDDAEEGAEVTIEDAESEASAEETEEDAIAEDTDTEDADIAVDATLEDLPPLPPIDFTSVSSGIYEVGGDGTILSDLLHDNGKFKSEVALVNIEGLEDFLPENGDSSQFYAEVARRALSSSEQGHIIIADATEGARFSNTQSETNWNSGPYLGVKSFQMNPGDRVMLVMVPNGKFKNVLERPTVDGSKRLLFSASELNPEGQIQFAQVLNGSVDGNLITVEDLRRDRQSDESFDDLGLQIRNIEGQTSLLSDVIDTTGGFWSQDMGQALIEYAKPYVSSTPVIDRPDETIPEFDLEPCVMPDGCTGHSGVDSASGDESSLLPTLEADADDSTNTQSEVSIDTPADDVETQSEETTEDAEDEAVTESSPDSSSNTQESADSSLEETDAVAQSPPNDTDELTNESADLPPEETDAVAQSPPNDTDELTNESADLPPEETDALTQSPSNDTDELTDESGDLPPENTEDEAIDNPTGPIEVPEPVVPERFEFPRENQPIIGIIDTGLAANNPDIDYSNITLGSDRVDGDDNPLLEPGEGSEHGTHVVGIIAAGQDNGIGIDGINPDAPIVIERATGSGEWAESLITLVDRIRESEQPNGIINLSQDLIQTNPDGSITTRYALTPKERAAIEYARQNNILLVVAAGNDNGVMSALGQAGQEFDNIATVGAAKRLDVDPSIPASEAFIRADYSSYGYGLDLVAEGGTVDNPIFSTVGTGIGTMAGSSVAAANVTGGASLVWAANPGLNYSQVLQILKDTSTDLSTTNWDAETGSGLLNVDAAVKLAKVTAPEEYTPPASFIPDTWSGEDIVIPGERPVDFSGSVDGSKIAVQINGGLNIRQGPGTSFEKVGILSPDESVIFESESQGEYYVDPNGEGEGSTWYRLADDRGWVWAGYIHDRVEIDDDPDTDTDTDSDTDTDPDTDTDSDTDTDPDTDTDSDTDTDADTDTDPAYYPDLASLSDDQWNEYTGDNTRFDFGWPDYIDERHLTPQSIRDIYTDLSNAVLGKRGPVTAGYLLDPGYRQGIGKWHSGIDLDANPGDAVQVAVGGNVVTIQSISGDYFMGVQGDDGKLWIYGHLGTVAVPIGRIETGQTIGTIGSASHLHLEVQPGPSYSSSQSADYNVVENATLNPVKSFWELQNQNSFAPIDPETPGGSQPAIPGEQAEYIIKPGDTLSDIAWRYLGDANRWPEIMKSPDGETFTSEEAKLLQIGQSVYLPVTYETGDGGFVPNPPVNGSTDGMRPYEFGHLGSLDDTLWEIAERELGSGFRWTEIRKADGTTYTSAEAAQISTGTTVYLPDGNSSDGNTNPPDDDSQGSGNENPINDEQPGDENGNVPETLLIDVKPLSEVPLLIGQSSNPGWGKREGEDHDFDFTSGDAYPVLSSDQHEDFELDFWAGIRPIPGDLVSQMAERFLSGSGELWEHSSGSELSQLVESDDDFVQMLDGINLSFQKKLESQISLMNSINFNEVDLNLDDYEVNFEFPLKDVNLNLGFFEIDFKIPDLIEYRDPLTLWGAIGGTQGTELYLNQFNVGVQSTDGTNILDYSANLDFVIYDDFGAGNTDNVELQENFFKFPLRAMWHLQHRGRIAKPFVNKVVINREISGQIVV